MKYDKAFHDAARARGLKNQVEQARLQAERARRLAAEQAATDAAVAAQKAEHVSFGEQVRRQRLGVVVETAPATVGRVASSHVGRIHAAVSNSPAWRKFRADLAWLETAITGLEARARERDLAR